MKMLWFNEIFLCNFQEQTLRFRLSRFNRYVDYYDGDGDWGWFTVNIDEDKEQFYNLDIPLTTDDWFFNVFTVSKENGIGIINTPVSFSSKRPIHFYCEGKLRNEKKYKLGKALKHAGTLFWKVKNSRTSALNLHKFFSTHCTAGPSQGLKIWRGTYFVIWWA